jgi:hypothetical protein
MNKRRKTIDPDKIPFRTRETTVNIGVTLIPPPATWNGEPPTRVTWTIRNIAETARKMISGIRLSAAMAES